MVFLEYSHGYRIFHGVELTLELTLEITLEITFANLELTLDITFATFGVNFGSLLELTFAMCGVNFWWREVNSGVNFGLIWVNFGHKS